MNPSLTKAELRRQDAVAKNLVKNVTDMFYGGNHPSSDEITCIVNAYSETEEWALTDYAVGHVVFQIMHKLSN